MKIDTKDILAYSRKIMFFLIGRTYRSACEHPFVLGMLFFLLTLYILLPRVFAFLISFSPIIICTLLLLGTLLSFGHPSIPEIEEDGKKTHELSPLQVCSAANDLLDNEDRRFCVERHIKNKENFKGIPIKEMNFTEQGDHGCKGARGMLSSASNEKEGRKDEAVGTCSSLEWNRNQICVKTKATDKREINGKAYNEKAESLEELTQDAPQVVHIVTSGEKKTDNFKVESHEPTMEHPSLDSTHKHAYRCDESDSVSGHAMSNPPDASLTGITPMLKKHHPLMDSGAPQPVSTSVDNSHSVNANVEKESKHQNETQKEKSNESTAPVTCTEDDDKNHMDLSASILERSKRLKSLILKRRARKNLRAQAERNFRGLDVHRSVSIMDDLSDIQLRIPPISTGKQNPFDLPLYSEESIIPGSAPSVFLPRGNIFDEFDLPYGQEDDDDGLAEVSLGHPGSLSLPPKDPFFRRYESFSLGASFPAVPKQEKHDSRLRPDFGNGRMNLEEAGCSDFRRQMSDKRFSRLASIPGSGSNSSVVDMEYSELLEQELNQDRCSELFPCDDKRLGKETNPSNEVYLVESPHKEKEIDICGIHEVNFSTFKVVEEKSHETFDDFVEYEMKVMYQMGLHPPTSDTVDSDLAEMKYMEPSSSCSLGVGEKNFGTMTRESLIDFQQTAGSHLKCSNSSVHSYNKEGETLNDIHVPQSVYDSSPSADFNCTSSTASETQTETSDLCSPWLKDKNNSLEVGDLASGKGNAGGMHVSDNGALWMLPSNFSSGGR